MIKIIINNNNIDNHDQFDSISSKTWGFKNIYIFFLVYIGKYIHSASLSNLSINTYLDIFDSTPKT